MTTFAIIAPAESATLKAAIEEHFKGNYFEFGPGQFVMVAPDVTSRQVSETLGPLTDNDRFVVFTVAGHWGFHRKDLWEWLSVRSAA